MRISDWSSDVCSSDLYPIDRTFDVADAPEPDRAEVVSVLRESGAEVLMNYLPVGSQEATVFYAECALEAGVAFVNNIPVFLASDPVWANSFPAAVVPIIGADRPAQLSALHALRSQSCRESRRSYQASKW